MDDLDTESFCHVTTVGRVTGRPHTIEIWYSSRGSTVYLLAGGRERADWVRNIAPHPQVRLLRASYRHRCGRHSTR